MSHTRCFRLRGRGRALLGHEEAAPPRRELPVGARRYDVHVRYGHDARAVGWVAHVLGRGPRQSQVHQQRRRGGRAWPVAEHADGTCFAVLPRRARASELQARCLHGGGHVCARVPQDPAGRLSCRMLLRWHAAHHPRDFRHRHRPARRRRHPHSPNPRTRRDHHGR